MRSFRTIGKMMKLGKQRPPPEDEQSLMAGSKESLNQDHGQ